MERAERLQGARVSKPCSDDRSPERTATHRLEPDGAALVVDEAFEHGRRDRVELRRSFLRLRGRRVSNPAWDEGRGGTRRKGRNARGGQSLAARPSEEPTGTSPKRTAALDACAQRESRQR